jgi:hypothetical protein
VVDVFGSFLGSVACIPGRVFCLVSCALHILFGAVVLLVLRRGGRLRRCKNRDAYERAGQQECRYLFNLRIPSHAARDSPFNSGVARGVKSHKRLFLKVLRKENRPKRPRVAKDGTQKCEPPRQGRGGGLSG